MCKKKLVSLICLFTLLAAFLLTLCCLKSTQDKRAFLSVSQDLLKQTYEQDSLSSHFAFSDPTRFGIDDSKIQFPCYAREDYLHQKEETDEVLTRLAGIDRERLSGEAKQTYDVLRSYLTEKQRGADFLYFEEPLSPTSGIHISLPVLLAEYAMENERDVTGYLALLKQLPAYFDSLAAFETDRAAQGMFMASEDVALVISQCHFMASEQGERLFAACFAGQLKNVYSIGDDAFSDYQKKQKQIFKEYVAPAYLKLADSLSLLQDDVREQRGLCQYKNGREYYEYHVQNLVGTDKTCEEMLALLQKRYAVLCQRLYALRDADRGQEAQSARQEQTGIQSSQSAQQEQTGTLNSQNEHREQAGTQNSQSVQPSQYTTDKDDINRYLPALTDELHTSFPTLPAPQSVLIKEIPSALADYTAPAYYFIPRIQPCRPGQTDHIQNVIYYAKDSCSQPIHLYTTLAHEGYPGHMYQNVYFTSLRGVNEENVLRYRLDFPGYQEGWAMYAEFLSFDHAAAFTGIRETYCQMLKLSREIQICMLCILDIEIHANGALLRDITPALAGIGVREPDTICETYSYLINEPGTYLKYYMGYLELLSCRELYKKKCAASGTAYTDMDFHTFFLSHGPDSYVNIKKEIKAK